MNTADPAAALPPSFSIFKNRAFLTFLIARISTSIGVLAESVTLGWQVYVIARLTHSVEQSAFLVGMIGLAQFLPLFLLALVAGEAADRYDRRHILLGCVTAKVLCAALLAWLAYSGSTMLAPIFAIAVVFGMARAFLMPASAAMGPMLVDRAQLPRAIAWSTLGMQAGMIAGPWLGGFLCSVSPALSYGASGALYILAGIMLVSIRVNTKPESKGGSRLLLIREGIDYVWNNRIVFGAISLDLFAVLLGGATALLPVFARDILHIGADGFGLLRAGPALGGATMAFWLSRKPIERWAGPKMLIAVGVFGIATLAFALSRDLIFSVAALAVLGAADTVSVFIRQSLIQLATPDAMRGRVSAVSSLFISASNELGEFESGVAARLLGPVGAAIFGGVGSLVVTGLWARLFPELRKADRLV